MKKVYFAYYALILSIAGCVPGYAQNSTVVKSFIIDYWDSNQKVYRDSVCNLYFDFKNDKLETLRLYPVYYDKSVTTAYLLFKNGNFANLAPFVQTLKSVKHRFEKWASDARQNNVKDFSKSMEDKDLKITSIGMFVTFKKGGEWYEVKSGSGSPLEGTPRPILDFTPYFWVDANGVPRVLMGFKEISGRRFEWDDNWAKSNMLKTVLVPELAIKTFKETISGGITLQFSSLTQIQSLIDALEYYGVALEEIKAKQKAEKAKRDSISALFK